MRLIEIYDGTLFQSQTVRNLLEIEGIEVSLKDEITGTRGGGLWRPAGGVKVVISDQDIEKATKIVNEFVKSQSEE